MQVSFIYQCYHPVRIVKMLGFSTLGMVSDRKLVTSYYLEGEGSKVKIPITFLNNWKN